MDTFTKSFLTMLIDNYAEIDMSNVYCPVVKISTKNKDKPVHRNLVKSLLTQTKIPYVADAHDTVFTFHDTNAIDLLGMVYGDEGEGSSQINYTRYRELLSVRTVDMPVCHVFKTHPNAVVPYKTRESDVGYDMTLISVHKKLNDFVTLYDTGIKLKVCHGYYVEVVPRSSIIKSGHIMANNVGIIDRSYEGNVYVALAKLDASVPDIQLPYRGFQMIFRKQIHGHIVDMKDGELNSSSSRGEGGFGSTGGVALA